MVDRIQLSVAHYMKLDGQWTIVESGTVIDVPDAAAFQGTAKVLSPGEAAGTLTIANTPTPVRSVRRR